MMEVQELRAMGFVRLPRMAWIRDFVAHIDKCEKFPGHVKARVPKPGIFCHAPEDVIAAPGLLGAARILTPLATEYFGEPAVLWSLNAFYTMPDAGFWRGLHGLHSDVSSSNNTVGNKALALFVLGYDTDIQGAHMHVRPDGLIEPIYGPAGTAWVADQSHLHCGLIPDKPRLLLWARWAEKLPPAYYEERLPVLP